jgi:protein ImuB
MDGGSGRSAGVRTMVVWCPDWSVVAAGHRAGEPVAVVLANRVVACSAAARDDGVAVGLRRREAQSRCPEVVVVEQDHGRDARGFEAVVAAVEAFTPRMEVGRPGVVSFETRGPSRYFGGDRALATKVAAAVDAILAPLGAPRCRVGVADGPFTAELAAASARGPAGGPGEAAAARPVAGGAVVVPPGASAGFLAPFPVQVLERPDFADLLSRLGLKTLGDLAALAPETVLARFGADGAVAHRLASGLDERPLEARSLAPELTVAAVLDPPAERVDMAMFVAKALADELHESLAARGLACTRIAIEAETEHGEHILRLWRHDGALSSRAIAERVRWQLDGWLSTGATTAGVTLIRLIPDEVKPEHGRQLGFWGGSAEAHDRAARGFARIQGLLGPEGVVTATVGGGRDPAGQVRLIPWGDPRPEPPKASRRAAATREVAPWPGHLPLPAPAVVYPERLAATLHDRDGQPVTVSGRGLLGAGVVPATLAIDGAAPVAVVAWAGPWPAEERWWDQEASRRRARFQVCVAGAAAAVVVLENGQWWVEALYD